MFKFLRWLFGYRRVELTLFQAAIAANIRAASNQQTLKRPARDLDDLAA